MRRNVTVTVKPIALALWTIYGRTRLKPIINWREIANRWAADEFLRLR